ncbi:helix-turn-helix domain-containing protein [Bacillus sp. 2205SS5-2]|uniref:helix-turn-helix domain-containing protein n=1 Tax=Bacillus sp. 2205SS5-2 TaxID=3109031 RepID=UPI0030055754
MRIGVILQHRRKELGLTQEVVCSGICSITYLSKVENNVIAPKNDILQLLCNRLDLNLNDLKEGDSKSLKALIKEAYEEISRRNEIKIEILIDKLIKKNQNLIDPEISIGYFIVLANYAIYKNNQIEAQNYLHKANNMKKYMTLEYEYWYHKSNGFFQYLFGSIENSKSNYEEAQQVLVEMKGEDANLYFQLGMVNSRLKKFEQSNKYIKIALVTFNQELNFKKIVECNLIIGINYSKVGNFNKAEEYFLKLIDNLNYSDNQKNLSRVYHNLGIVYSYKNELVKSLDFFGKSLDLKDKPAERANTIYLLAYTYKRYGDIDKAFYYMDKGIKITENIQSQLLYKFQIMKLYSMEGSEIQLIELVENTILPYYLETDPILSKECMLLLAELYQKINHYKSACKYFEKYLSTDNTMHIRKELLY